MKGKKLTLILYLSLLMAPFLFGCSGNSSISSGDLPSTAIQFSSSKHPDAFIEVDCMLPGQVRKLGNMLYAGPRRPLKTTAGECEIRGGEYVVYDRANYKSSLAVWMVEAENGNAEAQTYVGEIYMKSPPANPRYDLAAKWFKEAATKGYKRALINLGYLYEHGLGVTKNMDQAVVWYSKASGVDMDSISQQYQLTANERKELVKLRYDNASQLGELKKVKDEMSRAQKVLVVNRQDLKKKEKDISSYKKDISKKRAEIAVVKAQLAASGDRFSPEKEHEVSKIKVQLEEREGELKKQKEHFALLSSEIARHQKESKRYQATIASLAEGSSQPDKDGELKQLRNEMEKANTALRESRIDFKKSDNLISVQQQELVQQREKMQRLEKNLAEKVQHGATKLRKQLVDLENVLREKGNELRKQKQLALHLSDEINNHKEQTKQYETRLARLSKKIEDLPGPKIEVLNPQLLRTRGITVAQVSPEVKQRAVAGKVWSPAGLQALKVNGKVTATKNDGSFRIVFPMSEEDVSVHIQAQDLNGKIDETSFSLRYRSMGTGSQEIESEVSHPSIAFGNYYALVIGNNNYAGLPKLKTAVEDARAVGTVLEKRYGFDVTILYNADRHTMLSTLNDFRKKLTEKDNFLIYYAGHGTLEERNTQGFWLPVDSNLDDDVNWLPTDRVTGIMNLMSAKQIMIIADACYSGIMTRASLTRLESGKSEESYRNWIRKVAAYKSRVVISSGENKPVLDGGGGKHSIFARALLETLRSNTKILLGIDLHRAIAEKVVDASGKLGYGQVPQYAGLNRAGHELGDFLFIPTKGNN